MTDILQSNFTPEDLEEILTDSIFAAAKNFLEGDLEQIKAVAKAIAIDTTEALMLPEPARSEILAELKGQVQALAEVSRVHATSASWDLFGQVTEIIAKTVLKTALSVLPIPT